MRRVSLLLLAVGLLVACNDKDDYQPEKDPIYLADKIVETILPVQGTHTMSITSEYKYRNTIHQLNANANQRNNFSMLFRIKYSVT